MIQGDHARVRQNVNNAIRGCAVGSNKLLADPGIRDKVRAVAAANDGPERDQARDALAQQIRTFAAQTAPVNWIDNFEILARDAHPGTATGWFGSIIISHIPSATIGTNNTVTFTERYRVNKVIIRDSGRRT